jgi:sulfocyanin
MAVCSNGTGPIIRAMRHREGRLSVKVQFSRHGRYTLAGAMALALALPGVPAAAAHQPAGTPPWLVVNARARAVTLTLIAGYRGGGFDFNGDSNGKMVISVPAGYKVNVIFSNRGAAPHSAVFTLYNKRTSVSGFPLAFPGAGSPNYRSGIGKGKTQRFSFMANKVGKYALVCAVPGHAAAGMWDVFQVTRGGKATISGVQGVGPRA